MDSGEIHLYPIADAQQSLGRLSRTTIYNLVNDGQLEMVHVGRRAFITAKSIAAYVDRLSEAATA